MCDIMCHAESTRNSRCNLLARPQVADTLGLPQHHCCCCCRRPTTTALPPHHQAGPSAAAAAEGVLIDEQTNLLSSQQQQEANLLDLGDDDGLPSTSAGGVTEVLATHDCW